MTITAADIKALRPVVDAAERGEIPEIIPCTCDRLDYRGCTCGVHLKPGIRTMEPRKTILTSWADMNCAWHARKHDDGHENYIAGFVLEARYEDLRTLFDWYEGLNVE